MKKNKKILAAFIFQLLLISCSKNGGTDAGTNPVAPLPNVLTILTNNTTTSVAQTSAVIGGNIIADGGLAVTARGICWNTAPSPTILNNKIPAGSGIGSFTATISGLTYATTYFVRAYATNSTTTIYGAEVSFTTKPLSIPGNGVTDVDGNTYTTVILGDKEWMVQNLRTTKYQNGDVIPNITTQTLWSTTVTGAWCYYNNTAGYNNTYGKLYNWYAATDPRQISPVGWHVPSTGEYTVLNAYLGGGNLSGGGLKQAGTSSWASPNSGATNISGFTALPGGSRSWSSSSGFGYFGTLGNWWSSDIAGSEGRFAQLQHDVAYFDAGTNDPKGAGFSIRCVKD
jgi:uncharacterized protein (TIGR02145 family)